MNVDGKKTNKSVQKDCFHCSAINHWVGDCPQLTPEERAETTAAMRKGTYRALPREQQEKNRRAVANMMIVSADVANIANDKGELTDVTFLQ